MDSFRTSEPAANFLRRAALAPGAPATLLLAGALLAFAGAQWPQADAPLAVADGLSRSDLLAIEALGLHRLGASVPAVLLATATLLVALARALLPAAIWVGRAELPMIHAALQPSFSARWPLRLTRSGGMRAGLPDVGAWLLAAAAACAFAHILYAATQPLPVLIDVPVGEPEAHVEAWRTDAGALAPAPGRWRGQCQRTGSRLRCTLDVPGARHDLTLHPGTTTHSGNQAVTWLDLGRSASPAALALQWQPAGARQPYALTLQTGQVRDAPALGLRLHPATTRATGPLVLGVDVTKGKLFALASPVLAPRAPTTATATGSELVRLQLATRSFDVLLLLALVLAVAGALAAWWLPGLILRSVGPDRFALIACNRTEFVDRIRVVAESMPPPPMAPAATDRPT